MAWPTSQQLGVNQPNLNKPKGPQVQKADVAGVQQAAQQTEQQPIQAPTPVPGAMPNPGLQPGVPGAGKVLQADDLIEELAKHAMVFAYCDMVKLQKDAKTTQRPDRMPSTA